MLFKAIRWSLIWRLHCLFRMHKLFWHQSGAVMRQEKNIQNAPTFKSKDKQRALAAAKQTTTFVSAKNRNKVWVLSLKLRVRDCNRYKHGYRSFQWWTFNECGLNVRCHERCFVPTRTIWLEIMCIYRSNLKKNTNLHKSNILYWYIQSLHLLRQKNWYILDKNYVVKKNRCTGFYC